MAAFDPLWTRPTETFAPSQFGHEAQPGTAFRKARPEGGPDDDPSEDVESAADEAGDPDSPDAADGPAEPEAYDPAADGWVRVEDHETALEAARSEAAEQARAELTEKLEGQVEQVGDLVEELERVVGERRWLRQEVIADAAEDVATLILELSHRIVGETLAVHPRALQHLVMEAMARLPGDDAVRVRVRPEDLPILEAHVDSRRPITWVPDPELKDGVVVQTDLGQVEASLEAAFSALQAAIDDWLEQQRG